VKKSLQGIKMQWQMTPILPAGPLSASHFLATQQSQYTAPAVHVHQLATSEVKAKSGVVKEGRRFSVFFPPATSATDIVYHFGTFDREEEANRVHTKVLCFGIVFEHDCLFVALTYLSLFDIQLQQSLKLSGNKFNVRHHLLKYGQVPELPVTVEMIVGNTTITGAIDYTSILNNP
jgi:hypothetical protein